MPDPAAVAQLSLTGVGLLALAWANNQRRRPGSSTRRGTSGRPGWIARRRARAGISHGRGRVGIGYVSATRTMTLSGRELAGHGAVFGGPGSGKTTLLQLLVEAAAGNLPVVIVDPKGSPALEAAVRAHGGQVWTLDGKLPADLLDPRPWQVPDLLLEAEDYSADARAYRDAAHQRALWAAWSLALDGRPMDLAELRRRLDRDVLVRILELHHDRDPRIADWIIRLEHQRGGIEDSGARGLDRALGTLLDGVALRGSLRACPEALRLDDVLDTRGVVLFSLDAAEYPHATRKVASWILLGMGRLARHLSAPTDGEPRAMLLVDEVGALGSSARHLRGLVGRARESGLAVVLATQGPSDLEAVDQALLPQIIQDTAWQLVFRQGTLDSARASRILGVGSNIEIGYRSDGLSTHRAVEAWGTASAGIGERVNVPPSALEMLERGDAWLRIAAVDRRVVRLSHVRVALPRPRPRSTETSLRKSDRNHVSGGRRVVSDAGVSEARGTTRDMPSEAQALPARKPSLPPVPPDCPAELLDKVGADVLAKVERRWSRKHHELGPCLVWTGPTLNDDGRYGWMWDAAIGRMDVSHRVVWRRVYGPIPTDGDGKPLEVDHKCDITLCQRPDHLRLLSKRDNVKRRGPTRGRGKDAPSSAPCLDIALFERYDRPAVQARALGLDDLRALLATSSELADKRQARCWSPTRYADGMTSRSNAGVSSVTCLVFDLDRMPPDPKRLEGVCWIGHTTWSHTPETPKWRVVIPLAKPVPAKCWAEVWQRARAALCPEADPSCKDPSRQYYLPSHPAGTPGEHVYHAGPLLDASTLPELPPAPRPPKLRRVRVSSDPNRGQAYMDGVIRNLETATRPGRNNALNGAAWTLGQWVAAGTLEQADVEEALYAAAVANGLVADDGERQCWATIRSGLGAGLQEPVDLNAKR